MRRVERSCLPICQKAIRPGRRNQRGYKVERGIDRIVVSSEAPMSCVRRIRNALLELPNPNSEVTSRYFQ